jgi:Zn-dependent alcohol dehydrogenase
MTLTTRAAVLRTPGARLEVEELEVVAPGPGEVLVRLGASGICGTDYSNARASTARVPLVLGHEGAGVVEAVGDGVTRCAVGDHVVLSLISQCGACAWCLGGQPELCGPGTAAQRAGTLADGRSRLRKHGDDVYQFLGLGTFSERIVVAQTALVPIPAAVPMTSAALLGCGVLTGLGAAMRTAPAPRGGTVLVMGCGGVGMNIVQGARLAGAAHIIAVDPVEAKSKIAATLGATRSALPGDVDAVVAQVTSGVGVDVAYDVVGSAATTRACIDSTRRGGRICVVGAKYGAEIGVSMVEDLIRGAKVLSGCNYGSSMVLRDIPLAVSAYISGNLELDSLVTHTVALDEINDALALIETGEGVRTVIEY